MQITIELPEDIAVGLESKWKDLPRAALDSSFKRYTDQFSKGMAFQLTKEELEGLNSRGLLRSRPGGRGQTPWVLTEDGVALLSTIMRDKRVAQVNKAIEWGRWGSDSDVHQK